MAMGSTAQSMRRVVFEQLDGERLPDLSDVARLISSGKAENIIIMVSQSSPHGKPS
jgi:hypothetical protein